MPEVISDRIQVTRKLVAVAIISVAAATVLMAGCRSTMNDNPDSSAAALSVEVSKKLESWQWLDDIEKRLRTTIEQIACTVTTLKYRCVLVTAPV